MKVASLTEVASDFARYLKASERGPVVVTRKGKPVAVLLRTEDEADLERLLLGHSPGLERFWKLLGSGFDQEPVFPMKPSGRKSRRRTPVEPGNQAVHEKTAEPADRNYQAA